MMASISLIMLLGTFLRRMNSKYGIPYNPSLLVFGILAGYYCDSFNSIYFEAAIKRISQISAVIFYFNFNKFKKHGIFQIFLPILIFEASFNMDWYVFKKEFAKIFVLAFPCVLLNALLTQIFIKIFFYTDDVINNIFNNLFQIFCLMIVFFEIFL